MRLQSEIQGFVMRYSIMLQLVATITFIFLGTAALFAWLQYRPGVEETNTQGKISYMRIRVDSEKLICPVGKM